MMKRKTMIQETRERKNSDSDTINELTKLSEQISQNLDCIHLFTVIYTSICRNANCEY